MIIGEKNMLNKIPILNHIKFRGVNKNELTNPKNKKIKATPKK